MNNIFWISGNFSADSISSKHSLNYRPDIDGLRAFAILGVFFFHLFPRTLRGGFAGVDIFFVISGFLISSIILKQLSENKFSFVTFYSRRIRRIYPCLLLVLTFCLAFGCIYLIPSEYELLGKHAFGGSVFISNIFLLAEDGYFDTSSTKKLLLHLWSLGIEEQFYILWPFILFFAFKVKKFLLPAVVIFAVASFAANMASVFEHSAFAFYSPITRFWELICGALLSYLFVVRKVPTVSEVNSGVADALSVFGMAAMAAAYIFAGNTGKYPGVMAILPVASCVMLIAAGPVAAANKYVLSNRCFVWIGLVSYPMYLWHWPFISFSYMLFGESPSVSAAAVIFAVTVLLSFLSFRFVENPIRRGGSNVLKVAVLLSAMALVGLFGLLSWKNNGAYSTWNGNANFELKFPDSDVQDSEQCPNNGSLPKDTFCLYSHPDAPKSVGLIGSSYAHQYYSFLKNALGPNINLKLYAAPCTSPFINLLGIANRNERAEYYKAILAGYDDFLSDGNMDVIVLGHALDCDRHNKDMLHPDSKNDDVNEERAMRRTFDALRTAGKKVFFVIQEPTIDKDPTSMIKRPFPFDGKSDTLISGRPKEDSREVRYGKILREVAKDYGNLILIDATDLICEQDYCYVARDGVIYYIDDGHLSKDGVELFGQKILEEIMPLLEK